MLKLNHLSNFKKASIALIASISFASLAIPYAMAESTGKDIVTEAPADMDFKKLDVNGDKKVSLKEAIKDKTLATSFDATDANKDGNITLDEYASYKTSLKSLDGAAPAVAPVN